MIDKTWHTYAEAAAALGLSVEGVRQRARREHWRKTLGNDGKALVMLPEDAERVPAGDADGDRADNRPSTGRAPAKQPAGEVEALQARVAELRADLERERAEKDRERAERGQERDRADKLAGELTETTRRLLALVEEMRELAAVRERLTAAERRSDDTEKRRLEDVEKAVAAGRAEADRVRAELEAWRARPWWRRIAG